MKSTWLPLLAETAPARSDDSLGTADWELALDWPWLPSFTVLFVVAAIAWVVYCYFQEGRTTPLAYRMALAAIRIAALAVMLLILSHLVVERRVTGLPEIAILIDRSASMSIADVVSPNSDSQAVTRLDWVRSYTLKNDAQFLSRLAEDFRLRTYLVDASIENPEFEFAELSSAITNLDAGGAGAAETRLGDALQTLVAGSADAPPTAAILFTDGANTGGASLAAGAQSARRMGVPLYTVGVGREQSPRDVQLSNVLVDESVFLGDLLVFRVSLNAQGYEGQQARLVLRQAGASTNLAETTVQLADDRTLSAQLIHRPQEAGNFSYTVEVRPLEGEIATDNNDFTTSVRVHDQAVRVLLACGYPSYEFRYLKTLLSRDPTIELDSYLQEADAAYAEQEESAVRTFPLGRDALLEYDVVILGDLDPRLLPRSVWSNLRSLVEEEGGGLAFIAGPRYLPAAFLELNDFVALAPVQFADLAARSTGTIDQSGFTPQPTPIGLQLPPFQLADDAQETRQVWQSLPPLYWYSPVESSKPAAQVLAVHPTRTGATGRKLPLIALQYFGKGRVLYHAIDSTWRWRLRVGDVYFSRYWVQTIRYLARTKLASRDGAELTVNQRSYEQGEAVAVELRLFEASAAREQAVVLLEGPEGDRRVTLDRRPGLPGSFVAKLDDLPVGDHRLVLLDPQVGEQAVTADFSVVAPPGEFARPVMDRAALMQAAELTHGKFYTTESADTLLDDLPTARPVPLGTLPALPIWNHPVVLTLLLVLLVSEWVLRRRKGMP